MNNQIVMSLANKDSNKNFDSAFSKSKPHNRVTSNVTIEKINNKIAMKQPLKNSKRSNYKRKKRERVIALIPTKTNTMIPSTPLPKEIIDYKNIILLRNGITAEGKIFPRRFTKLNAKQQRYMSKAIKNARMVGLLPFVKKFK